MNDSDENVKWIERAKSFRADFKKEISKAIVGQEEVIDSLVVCLLAGGHALLVGVPGLAKTLLIRSLSEATHLKFSRIQFTPDLMPADITGTTIIEEDRAAGKREFVFQRGPLFANIVLADEINRTPPKTQAALLESMQEHSITVGRTTYRLDEPFFVLATQNPLEQEGTYPLPEAQLDRFMFNLLLDYPSKEEEIKILEATTQGVEQGIEPVISGEDIVAMQKAIRQIPCPEAILKYTVELVHASRPGNKEIDEVSRFVRWGAGPRASQQMIYSAKARAALNGRLNVEFEDILAVAKPVMRHRILLSYRAEAEKVTSDDVIDKLLAHVKR